MKRIIYVLSGAGLLTFYTMTSALAATWQAVSFGLSPDPANQPYKYTAAPFLDGQYLSNDPNKGPTSFILSNTANISSTPTVAGEGRETIKFNAGGASSWSPPLVNTVAKTINVSSIFWEAQQGAYTTDTGMCGKLPCGPKLVWVGAIGGQFGPTNPVSYINNTDGTFTATWVATNGNNDGIGFSSFSEKQVYLTFATPVPEPAPVAMLAVGIAILFGVIRRRRS